MKHKTDFIYVIHAVGTNRVKIGFSSDPQRRLVALQTGSSFPLAIIGVRAGSLKLEQAIHGQLQDCRVEGEWFDIAPDEALKIVQDAKDPDPMLSEIDALLVLWQHSCAELRQAGVNMILEKDEINGTPAIILTLLAVNYCPQCQTFHDTKTSHTCIR